MLAMMTSSMVRPTQPVASLDDLYEAAEACAPIFKRLAEDVCSQVNRQRGGRLVVRIKMPTGLKKRKRSIEKSTDDYALRVPGPACGWLFDIVRGALVCEDAAAVVAVIEAVQNHPAVKLVVRFKNRFASPTPAGHRDVMIFLQVEAADGTVHTCELQVHLRAITEFSKFGNSHEHYEYFRTYFAGAAEAITSRMDDLKKIREINFRESLKWKDFAR